MNDERQVNDERRCKWKCAHGIGSSGTAGQRRRAQELVDRNLQTFGDDVRQMLEQRLTFDEAIRDESSLLVSKAEIGLRRELSEQLDKLELGDARGYAVQP